MPAYRKRYRKRTARAALSTRARRATRRYVRARRPRRYAARRATLTRDPQVGFTRGLSDQSFARMRFYGRFSLNSTATAPISGFILRGNGPFDPVYALGGSSALFWSKRVADYAYYDCMASRIHVNPIGLNGNVIGRVEVFPRSSVVPLTQDSLDAMRARINTPVKGRLFNGALVATIPAITTYMTTAKMFKGRKLDQVERETAVATSAATSPWYWYVTLSTQPVLTVGCGVHVDVTVDYYVRFYGRREDAVQAAVTGDPDPTDPFDP